MLLTINFHLVTGSDDKLTKTNSRLTDDSAAVNDERLMEVTFWLTAPNHYVETPVT